MKIVRAAALLTVLALLVTMCCSCGQKPFGWQLEKPAKGEEVAIMHTNMGDMHIRFFPEQAPKAVENFKGLAQQGYYDGLTFHRVIDNFMIQGGDPTASGSGGQSFFGGVFEDEFDPSLGNLRGALAMANPGEPDNNGSQFFINQADAEPLAITETRERWEKYKDSMPSYSKFGEFYAAQNENFGFNGEALSDEVLDTYERVGGNMYLDGPLKSEGGHTVFGQVYEGMDVLDAIAAVKTDENDKPLEDVIIESIEWTTYQG